MEYKTFGSTGASVSRIAFGCMSLGRIQAENERLIHSAIDHGINYFDTADIYDGGNNEQSLGTALKQGRNKVFIATKGGNEPLPDGSRWKWNPTKEYLIKAAEASLRRLQTDYIDVYQLHGGTIEDNIDETVAAFETLQAQGKIRWWGISSIRPNVMDAYLKRKGLTSVMLQYSLLDRRPEEHCLTALRKANVSVMVRGSVAGGLLAGKSPDDYLDYSFKEVEALVGATHSLSGKHRSMAQTSMRFVLRHPSVTSVVAGIRNEVHLKEALTIFQTPPLEEEEMNILTSVVPVRHYTKHRII